MRRYQVTVTRDGKWWMVHIPEVDGLTQARRLSDAGEMAREYIAAALDVEFAEVEVEVHVASVAGIDVDARLKAIEDERARAKELERRASEEAAQLAKELAKQIPLRDVGAVLGVSYQRAHQLVQS